MIALVKTEQQWRRFMTKIVWPVSECGPRKCMISGNVGEMMDINSVTQCQINIVVFRR